MGCKRSTAQVAKSKLSPGFGRTRVGETNYEVATGPSSSPGSTDDDNERDGGSGREDSILSGKTFSTPRGSPSRPVLAGPLATEVPVVLGGDPGRGACAAVQRRTRAGRKEKRATVGDGVGSRGGDGATHREDEPSPRVPASPVELAASTSRGTENRAGVVRRAATAEKAHNPGVSSATGDRRKKHAEVLSDYEGDREELAMGILPTELLRTLFDDRVVDAGAGCTQVSAELEGETFKAECGSMGGGRIVCVVLRAKPWICACFMRRQSA